MKKMLSILSAAALLMTVSCAGKKNDSSTAPIHAGGQLTKTGREVITVGMPAANQLIIPALTAFNNAQDKYEIQIVDYSKLVDDDDEEHNEALKQLSFDIITGNAPDIIAVNPSYMYSLVKKGTFADMYELMDEYGGVSREEFLPNVLSGFEVKGTIPAISPNFYIETAIAKTSLVGEDMENWTLEDFINVYDKLPDGVKMLHTSVYDAQSVYEYVSKKLAYDCIDFSANTCDFSAPAFSDAVDFVCRFGKENTTMLYDTDKNQLYGNSEDFEYELMNGGAVISCVTFGGWDNGCAYSIWDEFGGEPVTYVGYPSSDGNGALTYMNWLYGITDSSPNKEAAWQFILYLLKDEDYQKTVNEKNGGIPVIKSVLDGYTKNTDPNDDKSIYFTAEWKDTPTISEERVSQFYDYICSVKLDAYFDFEINSMIDEECGPVIAGERSGEECAQILDDRISIYLAERE